MFGSNPNGDENFVESKALLDYSKLSDGTEVVKPSSMALSEYHFLLLIGNKVKVCFGHMSFIHPSLQFDLATYVFCVFVCLLSGFCIP